MTAPLEIALSYIRRGWNPVPVGFREKKPTAGEGWQNIRITAENAARHFNGAPQNTGVQLGPASNNLRDIDLDCPEALAAAPYFLPKTGAIFGRPSARNAHWLYYADDFGERLDKGALQYRDPSKKMLVELRVGEGDKGAQSVFPGSTHVSGEEIRWELDGEPAKVDGADLRRRVEIVAAIALLARSWPEMGSRHEARLAIGGMLARAGWKLQEADLFAQALKAAVGSDSDDFRPAIKSSFAKVTANQPATGFTTVAEIFGKEVGEKVRVWLRLADADRGFAWNGGDSWGPLWPPLDGRAIEVPAPTAITPTRFVWRDPATIPTRQWLYGHHLIRKFVSCTFAAGGVGKSTLILGDAIAMVTGRNLLGMKTPEPLRVWVWNGEDPREELERRIAAFCLHHEIGPEDIGDRLFFDSGREVEIVLADMGRGGVRIATPVVDAVRHAIEANKIDVLIIDPFVSSHRVIENDNGAIDAVAKTWAKIADATGCAIELVHHVRKTGGAEITAEDGRGAVSLIAAARSVRVLNVMSKDEAENAGVTEDRLTYFRADNGKANLAPRPDKSDWFHIASQSLRNGPLMSGDCVGVATRWEWPNALDGLSAADLTAVQARLASGDHAQNVQAADWAGRAIGEALGMDVENPAHKARIKALLKSWIGGGALRVETRRSGRDGRDRPMIVVGNRA